MQVTFVLRSCNATDSNITVTPDLHCYKSNCNHSLGVPFWVKSWHFHIITVPNRTAVNVLLIFQNSLHCNFHFRWFSYVITFQWWQQQICFLLAIKAAFVFVSYSNCMCHWDREQQPGAKKKKKGKQKKWCKNVQFNNWVFCNFFVPPKITS